MGMLTLNHTAGSFLEHENRPFSGFSGHAASESAGGTCI